MSKHQTFHRLALAALTAACLSLPAQAASDGGRLAQAETAPGPMVQEPMGGQFGGTTLGSGLEDGAANDTAVGIGQPYQSGRQDFNDADDDDRRDPGTLSALMFLIMAAGIGGGILLMHFNRSDTAASHKEMP